MMSLNTEIEIKRWKPSKNDERKRCGPNLYVKGRLNGTKKFQMRIDSTAQEASVRKDFTRQSKKLQESCVVHSYSGMVWFVH